MINISTIANEEDKEKIRVAKVKKRNKKLDEEYSEVIYDKMDIDFEAKEFHGSYADDEREEE